MNLSQGVSKNTEVIIIGGGLSGCATAYFLSKGGLKVSIIEQRSIASGASGRNGSCITKMDSRTLTPEKVSKRLPYVLADLELLQKLEKELEIDFGLQQFGAIDIASSEEEIEEVRNMVNIQKAGGDNVVEFLTRNEVLEICPILGESALAAKYTKTDGSLNPIKLTYLLAIKAIEEYGAEILTNTKVEEIIFKRGKAIGIKTNKGIIRASEWIINCTNSWLYLLEPNIPFFPVQSVVSVTEKVSRLPIVTWESNHLGFYAYGTAQKDGNLIVGTLPAKMPEGPLGHFDETVQYEDVIRHGMLLRTLFPSLMDISIIRTWVGVFGMTPDRLPYIGPLPDKENCFINTGYSNGMCYCPIGAKLTSEYILNNRKTSLPIELLKPERYYGWDFEVPKYYGYDMLERILGEWNL